MKTFNFEKISDSLHELKPSIINTWVQKVRTSIPSAHDQSVPTLVDHLPSILENLCLIFEENGNLDQRLLNETISLNRNHGEQRARQTRFSLEEILKEFSILRETIIEHLYSSVTPHLESAKIIHRYLDRCVQGTILEFSRLQHEEIVQQKSHLETEKQLRQRFIAALTHDLRTPLAAAMMSAELMQRKSETTAMQQKYLGKISNNLSRMEIMIQDFLDVTLIKSGEPVPIKPSEFDLNSLIEETIEDLITIHGNRFKLSLDSHLNVHLGKRSLKRIIENLASNAIKYGAPNSVVTISLKEFENNLVLSVHNEGNPIDPEDIKNLFVPFMRTSSAKKDDVKGWGLGLPLVKGLVEAHGGSILAESNEKNGTTFTISMPQRI